MSHDNPELLDLAARYLPGSSSWMWSLPRDISFVVSRAEGSRLFDTNGRTFIDYALGSGPLLLGHAHPALTAAVHAQIDKGSTYQWLSEPTIRLAELVCQAAPCADMIRFMSTGTEATMFAIRMARAFTQREKIVKFEGGWHGLHDYALVGNNWRPSDAPYPTPTPDTGGIPKGTLESVLVTPFNDGDALEDILDRYDGEVAAVIVEPLQRAIAPQPGFLARLRELTARRRIVLIFDEVVTGFRLAYGGAQEFYGVTPDLATYGKAMSCGYPLAAVAGTSVLMATADPARRARSSMRASAERSAATPSRARRVWPPSASSASPGSTTGYTGSAGDCAQA
jgi:glutamate-1-semialdehyde 2,1-aminomutase